MKEIFNRLATDVLRVFFRLVATAFLFFYSLPIFSFDPSSLPEDGTSMLPFAEVWIDEKGGTSFAEMRRQKFIPLTGSSLGYSSHVHWFRIPVENLSSETVDWILEIHYSQLDHVELFLGSKGDTVIFRGGDRIPFRERPIQYRFPSFPLELRSGEKDTVYLKIETKSSVNFTVFAYKAEDFFPKISNEQILLGLYFGSLMVMALYNLFLFLSTRERTYLAFFLYVASGILVQWSLNGYAFQFFWPNAVDWASNIVTCFSFLVAGMTANFVRCYFDAGENYPGSDRILKVISNLSYILTILGYFIPFGIGLAIYIFLSTITFGAILYLGIQGFTRNLRSALFFLGAWIALVSGALLFVLRFSDWVSHHLTIAYWGVEIGTSLHVLLLALALADRVNSLSKDLSSKVEDLNDAKHAIEQSELRFRNLFEGAEELLLTLDQEGKIKDANRTLSRLTGYRPLEVEEKNFLDLIYSVEGQEDSIVLLLAEEKLQEHLKTRKTVEFHSEFKQKYVMEPKPVKIRLQSFESESGRMVLGKVSEISEDILSRFLVSESMHFTVNNYLRNADILSRQLTSNLSQFTGSEVITAIRTCVREVLINAIEHGNLGISFDEKTESMKSGNYMEFIQKRQREAFYGARSVTVAYSLNAKRIGFEIEDQGDGFDFKKVLNIDGDKLNEESFTHGRGIMMTRKVFDVVKFNDKGNKVLLIKYLQKPLKYKREPSFLDID
ncbi:PAS domain S-box protein [Leptospira langatensis]|uniref:PAS domain S-box protein n=1 Tax=Leptospira langatensis TaxID=2484983 RepID=A0A5F1ZNX4_9LEPT|nr:7TM diverse intracellular signaling domain-containing protein [Leptospira langatensis]TGK05413.1 PAS domain S-box protein [Leptospira langatensis]TGL38549.1 PAS domain S-box protein [Leptospira langatensis]